MPDDFEWPSAPGWQTRYSLEFLEQMQGAYWRSRRSEILSHLRDLLEDPQGALHSERLLREHRGLRSARFGWRLRLLFKLCGECRMHGDRERYALICCIDDEQVSTPDQTINVLYLSDHYGDAPDTFELDEEANSAE